MTEVQVSDLTKHNVLLQENKNIHRILGHFWGKEDSDGSVWYEQVENVKYLLFY